MPDLIIIVNTSEVFWVFCILAHFKNCLNANQNNKQVNQ